MSIKFTLFKNADIEKYLSTGERKLLSDIAQTIFNGRIADNKKPDNIYLIINTDEPYAKDVIRTMKTNGHFEGEITNLDKIKAMTVEEMAEFLAEYVSCSLCMLDKPCETRRCANEMHEWLESEVQSCKGTK